MAQQLSTLKDLDTPLKVLFSGYLTTVAVGYMVALIQILFTHGMADGEFGLSIDDIVYSYYGDRSGTVLEAKLNGSMKDKAPDQERFTMIQWIRDGAEESKYKSSGVEQIINNRCVMCHNENAGGLPDFTKFKHIAELTEQDEGATFSSLTRVSHIHLFGISFIFMFVGIIFSFAETTKIYYKCIAIGMPYVFLLVDILSWWLTKMHPSFAILIILAGGGMAVSFAFMWLISVLEMWAFNTVFLNAKGERYPQWSSYVENYLLSKDCEDIGCLFKKICKKGVHSTFVIWNWLLSNVWPQLQTSVKALFAPKHK